MNALGKLFLISLLTANAMQAQTTPKLKDAKNLTLSATYALLAAATAWADYQEASDIYNHYQLVDWSKQKYDLLRKALILHALTYTAYKSSNISAQYFKKVSPNNIIASTLTNAYYYLKSIWPFQATDDDIIKNQQVKDKPKVAAKAKQQAKNLEIETKE